MLRLYRKRLATTRGNGQSWKQGVHVLHHAPPQAHGHVWTFIEYTQFYISVCHLTFKLLNFI